MVMFSRISFLNIATPARATSNLLRSADWRPSLPFWPPHAKSKPKRRSPVGLARRRGNMRLHPEDCASNTIDSERDWHAHWNTIETRARRDELLRQVERTVSGLPADERQIEIEVQAARAALDFQPSD